jgi:hypothetical protein
VRRLLLLGTLSLFALGPACGGRGSLRMQRSSTADGGEADGSGASNVGGTAGNFGNEGGSFPIGGTVSNGGTGVAGNGGSLACQCETLDPCSVGSCDDSGVCQFSPKDCSEIGLPNECFVGTCEPSTGECIATPASGSDCNTGEACVLDGVCEDGVCVGTNADCSELDDVCLVGSCQADTGECVATPRDEGTQCDDGDACTDDDGCTNGACTGTLVTACVNDDGCCPLGCLDQDSDCGVPCADIVSTRSVWGQAAKGLELGPYTNGTLDWLGCVTIGCAPNSFYCNDIDNGIEFGSTTVAAGNVMRSLIDPGNAAGDVFPTTYSNCCTENYPRDVCNAPSNQGNGINSPLAVCRALGYQNAQVIREDTFNFCPNSVALTSNGGDWSSDFDDKGYDSVMEMRCFN